MIQPERIGQNRQEPITAIPLSERSRSQEVREALALNHYSLEQVVFDNREILSKLAETPFRKIGQKLVKGDSLTFEEAFLGMTYVISATNKDIFRELKSDFKEVHGLSDLKQEELKAPAQTFLTAMAQRETVKTLSAEEIAGMVAGAMMDIVLRLSFDQYVLETGGMGGDKGFVINGDKKKVINASTLSAIMLSSMGIPVVKHGSYANTSAVGSTEAAEALGINIYQKSIEEIRRLFAETGFYFSDAHSVKTIHDLSHSPFMKHETINHIIGPMTPPIDRKATLNKVIGVNEGVHPSLIAKAYEILNEKGYQKVGNVVVVSGLSSDFQDGVDINDRNVTSPYMMLDEVSPHKTLIGIVQSGKYMGCFIISPEDFGINLDPLKIQVVNTREELLAANGDALKGLSSENAKYLAINAAIGLFAVKYLGREDALKDGKLNREYLQECFKLCHDNIVSGIASAHLDKIVAASNGAIEKEKGNLLEGIEAVIFDIDDTLISPKSMEFYKLFSEAVNRAIAKRYSVSYERAKEIADYFRAHPRYGGGEHALFSAIGEHFPEFVGFNPNFDILYEEMSAIDPKGFYNDHADVVQKLLSLRKKGIKVIGFTDAPEELSRKMLKEAGLDPALVFDMYIAGSREEGPHKLLRGEQKYSEIASSLGIPPDGILAIGDSIAKDIEPPKKLGMKTCYIGGKEVGYAGGKAATIIEVFERMKII